MLIRNVNYSRRRCSTVEDESFRMIEIFRFDGWGLSYGMLPEDLSRMFHMFRLISFAISGPIRSVPRLDTLAVLDVLLRNRLVRIPP
jgi:hypothetical protein